MDIDIMKRISVLDTSGADSAADHGGQATDLDLVSCASSGARTGATRVISEPHRRHRSTPNFDRCGQSEGCSDSTLPTRVTSEPSTAGKRRQRRHTMSRRRTRSSRNTKAAGVELAALTGNVVADTVEGRIGEDIQKALTGNGVADTVEGRIGEDIQKAVTAASRGAECIPLL